MKIAVPTPPESAFNPGRPISDLVRWQLRHMHEAEKRLPMHERTRQDIEAIKTEGEASEYLRRMTEKLHGPYKVKVPKPGPEAFNKHRKISDLIRSQLQHFQQAELQLPERLRTGVNVKSIRTEHQAASYIARVTTILHGMSDTLPAGSGSSARASAAGKPPVAPASTKPKASGRQTSSAKKRRRKG